MFLVAALPKNPQPLVHFSRIAVGQRRQLLLVRLRHRSIWSNMALISIDDRLLRAHGLEDMTFECGFCLGWCLLLSPPVRVTPEFCFVYILWLPVHVVTVPPMIVAVSRSKYTIFGGILLTYGGQYTFSLAHDACVRMRAGISRMSFNSW